MVDHSVIQLSVVLKRRKLLLALLQKAWEESLELIPPSKGCRAPAFIFMFSGVFYLGVFMREECTQHFPEQDVISAFVSGP